MGAAIQTLGRCPVNNPGPNQRNQTTAVPPFIAFFAKSGR